MDISQLIGGRISDADIITDTPIGDVQAFLVQMPNGKWLQCEVLADGEGNSGGHLEIEDITNEVNG